jgi:DNA-binding CsgD family transcriptional regulator/tetratricopeptide (TPR) repeat protein
MRDAIRWSHDLLEEDERRLFQNLAVFSGGFTLAAAAMVNGARDDTRLLKRIGSLVDKNLLQRDTHGADAREARFAMLETVREFGLEQFSASDPEQTVRRRHAEWCQVFAEQFWAAIIRGPVAPEQLRRVATDHDNLRAALGWLRERGEGEAFLSLAATVWPSWLFGNHLSEGRGWLEQALASAPDAPPALRAQALRGLGLLARPLGNDARAVDCLEESLALARSVDDPAGLARSLHMLAMAVMGRGDYRRARSLWYEALARFQSLPDGGKWAALVQHHLGLVAYGEGDLDQAALQLEDARMLHQPEDDRRGVASSLLASALVAREHGDVARSAALYRESLTLWTTLGIQEGLAAWLAGVATLAVARDRLVQAARLFGAADRLAEQVGVTFHLPERAAYDRAQATIRGEIGQPRLETAREVGRELTQDQAVAEALSLVSEWDAETLDGTVPPEADNFGLTPRERDVLRLLATGSTDREIATALFVSPRTIQTHVANIRKKLDASSRTEAAALAYRHDLV